MAARNPYANSCVMDKYTVPRVGNYLRVGECGIAMRIIWWCKRSLKESVICLSQLWCGSSRAKWIAMQNTCNLWWGPRTRGSAANTEKVLVSWSACAHNACRCRAAKLQIALRSNLPPTKLTVLSVIQSLTYNGAHHSLVLFSSSNWILLLEFSHSSFAVVGL